MAKPRLRLPGTSGNPPGPPKGDSHVHNVSTDFLRSNKLCIKFNKGECSDASPHPHPFDKNKTLYHKCGACKKAGKDEAGHGAHDPACTNKQPFRRK